MRGGTRDSDASSASNRPSSASVGGGPRQSNNADAISKQSSIRRINSYLAYHSSPLSLSLKPLPSNRDIIETLKFILDRLEFTHKKVEEDLFVLLKQLNCPVKLNRSDLKAPGAPNCFPHVLAVLNWLVQLADYKDHLPSLYTDLNPVKAYALTTYVQFMRGHGEAVGEMNAEFTAKMEREKKAMKENVEGLEVKRGELEKRLGVLRSRPSPLEALEVEKQVLEKDKQKFEDFIAKLTDAETVQKALDDKEKELAAALKEKVSICKENEELKKMVETQTMDLWVAERMRREMQTVEREIRESETARNELEEKCWSIDEKISHQLKELDALSIESNQLLRRYCGFCILHLLVDWLCLTNYNM